MKIKKITPQKITSGLNQIFYTFSQTVRLVWSANPGLLTAVFVINILGGIFIFPTLYLEKLTLDALVKNIGNPLWREALKTLALLFTARILISIIQSGLRRISGFLQYAVAKRFSSHIDILLGKKMSELDMLTIENPNFKDRFNKVERESGRRAWGLAWSLANIPNYIFGLISTFSIIFFFKPIIALAIFLLSIPEFLVDAKYTKIEYQFESEKQTKYRLWGWLSYYLIRSRNLLETKILGLSPHFLKRIKGIQEEIFDRGIEIRKKRETSHFLSYLPQNILLFFLNLYFGLLVIWGKITIGSFSMLVRAAYSFQDNLTGLVGSFLELYENYLFVTDLVWYLNLKPRVVNGVKNFPKSIRREIEFKDIWFRYKRHQPWVLKGINLKIKAGENLALVGENGAGKTTLIKLLCRFYDPQKGEILIDGVNIREFKREELWKNLAVLFQNFEGYPFTARESIGYGRVDLVEKLDPIVQSSRKAQSHGFIDSLPLHYENPLDVGFEKGVEPSVGQWQRIALARTLFRGAQITILDEPTSNIDAKNEEEIFKKIISLTESKNLLLISHRFSTVRKADKICVIDKGKIVQQGSHEQLLEQKGIYAELFELQAKNYR